MDISLWCRWIPSISGFDTVSRPHFRSEWLLRFIYYNKIQHFDPMERDCLVYSIYWCNSINWTYLYDADGFLQFRLLIWVLELISVPRESWDSFILIKFNTLSIWTEIVSVHSINWCNSLNCAYLYDADGFLQFRLLIRVLELISVPNESWYSYILIKFNTLTQWSEIVWSIRFTGVIHLIGHNFMMQVDSFNFGFWFGF